MAIASCEYPLGHSSSINRVTAVGSGEEGDAGSFVAFGVVPTMHVTSLRWGRARTGDPTGSHARVVLCRAGS